MASDRDTLLKRVAASKPARGGPHSLQVAALCWRRTKSGKIRILLVTGRDSGRWVAPKGWKMRSRTNSAAAAREAWEEAGVRGRVCSKPVGIFTYKKDLGRGKCIPLAVQLYPIKVTERLKKYPETGQRKTKWFSRSQAAKRVREPELAALIRHFDPDRH